MVQNVHYDEIIDVSQDGDEISSNEGDERSPTKKEVGILPVFVQTNPANNILIICSCAVYCARPI